MINNIPLIAEVKTKSPFGYKSSKSWGYLFDLANRYGDIISIHPDSRWGGSFDYISKARELTTKQILAKGIHRNDYEVERAIEYGADLVLVVGRIPEIYQNRCLIEPRSLGDLKNIPPEFKVVWNSRDLETGGLKKETFEEARKIWSGWLCQASNISATGDIKNGADAVLVGSKLEEFCDSLHNI